MLQGQNSSWGWIAGSHETTRPSTTTFGATVTPGNNTYGSYVQLMAGASVLYDVWRIRIGVNTAFTSTAARNMLLTVGIDPAGGTSYTDTINHLFVTGFASYGNDQYYEFPLRIPAGASIGVKASVNNATVGTARAWCRVWGLPSRPEATRAGSYVETIGATTASSSGTAVTPGTTSEGAWADLGALTRPIWALCGGYGINSATIASETHHTDFGIGESGAVQPVIVNMTSATSTSETIIYRSVCDDCEGAVGANVWCRMQNSGSTTTNFSAIAYGVGG